MPGKAVLLSAILLPPVGLVLLWMRRGTRVFTKILGSLAILALGVAYLFLFFGLHVELDGSGMGVLFSFGKPEDLTAALEAHRAKQKGSPAPRLAAAAMSNPAPAAGNAAAEPAQPATEPEARSTRDEEPAAIAADDARAAPAGAAWSEFRGPRRDGRYDVEILTAWENSGLPLLWRQPIGGGYASFAIADGRAFTIEQRRNLEVVAAYDVETGRELWTHSWPGRFSETMGGEGPRATPTWEEGRVYALGAEGELRCLEAASGKRLWSRNILSDNGAQNITWGMAASPLVVDDKLIVLPGGPDGKSVVAYNKRTGEPVWKSLSDTQAYTSPMLVTLAGRRQILVVSAQRVMGLDTENGAPLWEHPWVTAYGINSAQPIIVDENHVFISASYDHGAALLEITPKDQGFAARVVWESKNLKNRFNSSVLYHGHIYGFDEAILACIDARTGERKWKGGRYGYGQVLLASGHLIVMAESGDLALVKATPEGFEEVARFSAIEGKTWNHPAIVNGRLLVRNAREMAAFRIAPK